MNHTIKSTSREQISLFQETEKIVFQLFTDQSIPEKQISTCFPRNIIILNEKKEHL